MGVIKRKFVFPSEIIGKEGKGNLITALLSNTT